MKCVGTIQRRQDEAVGLKLLESQGVRQCAQVQEVKLVKEYLLANGHEGLYVTDQLEGSPTSTMSAGMDSTRKGEERIERGYQGSPGDDDNAKSPHSKRYLGQRGMYRPNFLFWVTSCDLRTGLLRNEGKARLVQSPTQL